MLEMMVIINLFMRNKPKFTALLLGLMLSILLSNEMGAGITVTGNEAQMVSDFIAWHPEARYWQSEKYASPYFSFGFSHKETRPLMFSKLVHPESILTAGQLTVKRLAGFLYFHNPAIGIAKAHKLASLYIAEAEMENINHDIAFSQMCLETGFLTYTGDVKPEQNNFCGLGATGNQEPGLSFETTQEGIRAHIQHLKAYASVDSLNNPLVNSRFAFVSRGSAQTYKELTGKWATDPDYGKKIESLLNRIYSGQYAAIP